MKQDVTFYVEKFLTFWMAKDEHQNLHDKLQPLKIPLWKWEHITMDVITMLTKTTRNMDAIWVVEDILTKRAHYMMI